MGNNIKSLFNLSSISDSNSNQTNNNPQNNSVKINEKKEKSIPYSYTPNSSEEEENDEEKDNIKPESKLKCIKIIKGHYKWCNCLIILKSNNLCSCSGDKSINIYSNDNNFNVILKLSSCHDDFILFLLEIYDNIIASSSSDGTIKFWKIFLNSNISTKNNYYLIQTIIAHQTDAWKILFIEENNQLLSCGSDALVKVWNLDYIKKIKIASIIIM